MHRIDIELLLLLNDDLLTYMNVQISNWLVVVTVCTSSVVFGPIYPKNNVLYKCISLEAEERQCLVECSKHIYLVAINEFLSFFSLTASNVIFAPPLKCILMIVYKHLCISIINCV